MFRNFNYRGCSVKKAFRPKENKRQKINNEQISNVNFHINKYLAEEFYPVLEKYLSAEVTIRSCNNKILVEDEHLLLQFKEDLRMFDIQKNIVTIYSQYYDAQPSKDFKDYVQKYIENLDERIVNHFVKSTKELQVKKCQKKQEIYNFTDNVISQEQKDVLFMGKNSVVSIKEDPNDAIMRFESELKEFLKKYSAQVIGKNSSYFDEPETLEDCLKKAIENESDAEQLGFYKIIQKQLPLVEIEISQNCYQWNFLAKYSTEDLRKLMTFKDSMIIECDKNFGLGLVKIDDLVKADSDTMKKMCASKVEQNEDECLQSVIENINAFENSLNHEQKEFLKDFNIERAVPVENVKFPSLKNTLKVHKLAPQDIENKNIEKAKFRPVVAAEAWILNPYSQILMLVLREINLEVISLLPSDMPSTVVENGKTAASRMQKWDIQTLEDQYFVSITADMSDAYTNVFEQLLLNALEKIQARLKFNASVFELVKNLVKLVLRNNYIKTTVGIFLLGRVLPMGCSMSGDALDTVALQSEWENIFSLQGFLNKVSIKQVEFMRYKDDTNTPIVGTIENIETYVRQFAATYPTNIPFNLDLSVLGGKFLDVYYWRSISKQEINTTIARNFVVPPKYVPKTSMVPKRLKMCVADSEINRYANICSNKLFFDLNVECLKQELKAVGYDERDIVEKINLVKLSVSGDNAEKMEDERQMVYGATTKFSAISKTHSVLNELIRQSFKSSVRSPMSVPGEKLISFCFTKNMFQKRVKKYLKTKK